MPPLKNGGNFFYDDEKPYYYEHGDSRLKVSVSFQLVGVVATQICFGIFTQKIGEDEPNLTSIFFKWFGEKPPTSLC